MLMHFGKTKTLHSENLLFLGTAQKSYCLTTNVFQIMSPSAGKCTPQICPTTSNICQIRLELETFVITGPSTISTSVGLFLGGEGSAAGIAMGDKGTCKSDTFSITGASHIPVLCGTLTGEHCKFLTTI